MQKILDYLEGKKTYIVAGLVAVATVLQAFKVITQGQFEAVVGLLAAFGLYTVRSSLAKIEEKIK
jgi:hypothetical protein